MRLLLLSGFFTLLFLRMTDSASAQIPLTVAPIRVLFQTTLGEIVIDLDTERAPITTSNFLQYVETGLYDGAEFYRTVRLNPDNQPDNTIKIEVIQGGIDSASDSEAIVPIQLESTSVTGLKHLDGVISMARSDPNSATTEFFICIGDQPELDFGGLRNPDGQGFAAFGRVIEGMDVVQRIHQAPFDEQALTPPVKIVRVTRLAAGER